MTSLLDQMRKQICDIINSYDISLDVKYYVFKDILNELKDVYTNATIIEEEPVIKEEEKTVSGFSSIEKNAETGNFSQLVELLDKEKVKELFEKEGVTKKTFEIPLSDFKVAEEDNKQEEETSSSSDD